MGSNNAQLVPVDESTAVAKPQQTGLIDIGGGLGATIEGCMALVTVLEGATTLPDHYRSKPALMTAVLKAAQLGVPLMAVIEDSHFVKGKIGLGCHVMQAAVRGSGKLKSWREECTNEGATITAERTDGSSLTLSFTVEDAKRAGLGGDNWKSYPADMCRARCVTRICRRLFPDVLAGTTAADDLQDSEISARSFEPTGEEKEAERRSLYAMLGEAQDREAINAFASRIDWAMEQALLRRGGENHKKLATMYTDACNRIGTRSKKRDEVVFAGLPVDEPNDGVKANEIDGAWSDGDPETERLEREARAAVKPAATPATPAEQLTVAGIPDAFDSASTDEELVAVSDFYALHRDGMPVRLREKCDAAAKAAADRIAG